MKLPTLLLMLSGAAAGTLAQRGQEGQNDTTDQRPRFEVNVDMVSMSLTVFDENGKLVADLEKKDFKVYEDGVEQELVVFSREDLPLRMIILLDTSSSMRSKMEMAQDAAIEFVQSLKPGDRIKVIEFNDRVLNLIDFTADIDEVTAALRTTVAEGATALHNAIYISLQSLSRRREGDERQAVVVLSDGADTRSHLTFEDVRESARKTDVTIYAISLRGTKEDLKKNKYLEAKYVLEKLATESGGSSFSPEQINDLSGVYEQIATELKSQYNLGYISTNATTDGAWRRIQVLCNRPGLEVRTRNGYYAPRRRSRRPGN